MYIWGFFIVLMCSRPRHGKLCDMGIGIIFLFCTLIGIFIAVGGFRSRAVPCDPACGNCGYDLRGYAKLRRCSECGNDLTIGGSVRTTVFRTSGKRIGGGLLVVAMPWLSVAVLLFLQFLGPNFERVRSNGALIASIGKASPGAEPWAELTRRFQSGRLSKLEATVTINELIALMQQESEDPFKPFFWATNFFSLADHAGVITTPQYLAIAQACYGKVPTVHFPSAIPAKSSSQFSIALSQHGSVPGMHCVLTIQEISMTSDRSQLKTNLMGRYPYLTRAPDVVAGEYHVTFVIHMALLPGPDPGGPPSFDATPTGPPPLAQWVVATTKPVQVYGADYGQAKPYELIVRTDAGADPQLTNGLSITSVQALCYTNSTVLIFHLKVDHVPIWCSFNREITVNGQQFHSGSFVDWPGAPSHEEIFNCDMAPLPQQIHTAQLDLIPDLELARKMRQEQAWGKTITFKDIPFQRRELNFSLTKWRAEQKVRDLKAAATQLSATTLPSPVTSPAR